MGTIDVITISMISYSFCTFIFSIQNICMNVCATPSTTEIFEALIFGKFENMSFFSRNPPMGFQFKDALVFLLQNN
jgi:hypothetical protein